MSTVQLQQCRVCTKRSFNSAVGLVCGLTNAKPSFEGTCEHCDLDEKEALRIQRINSEAAEETGETGFFRHEKRGMKKGVLGGVVMVIIAVVWFVLGWMAGRIFFYPPVLLIIGIVAIVKGLADGNYAGEKHQ